jgi:hypothetical protein
MEQKMQKVMKKFPLFIGMGFMIVILAFIIGVINAGNAASYYAVDKAVRDSSTQWASVRASVESTVIWMPYFKFLGLAMILGGITMALGVIATTLEKLGKEVMTVVPKQARKTVPARPKTVMAMRMFMMLGMLVIIVGFIVALNVAGTAVAVFSNPVTTIDAAATGSVLLQNFASINANEAWLEAFKFVGVALMFFGIINGLATIIFALKFQETTIPQVVEDLPAVNLGSAIPAPTD